MRVDNLWARKIQNGKKKFERQKKQNISTHKYTSREREIERKIIQLWMGFVYSGADLWQKRFRALQKIKCSCILIRY